MIMKLFLLLGFNSTLSSYSKFWMRVLLMKRLRLMWKGVTCGRKHKRVTDLDLGGLDLGGIISPDIGNLSFLKSLNLEDNSFGGTIPKEGLPSELGSLSSLEVLFLSKNNLSGRLNGTIPQEIMQLESFVQLFVNSNLLTGPLPKDVGRLKHVVVLSVENNRLNGNIPEAIGDCLYMEELYLGGNAFDGVIPDIRNLRALTHLNLSNNNLSGNVPEYLANFSTLENLDLSGNNFEGVVPTKGVFQHSGNRNLCGGIPELKLKPCPRNVVSRTRRHSSNKKKIFIGVGIGIASLLLALLALGLLMKRKKKNSAYNTNHLMSNSPLDSFYERVSYEELGAATNEFSSSNLIGSGNFGSVFRGLLGPESKAVAVKVLIFKQGAQPRALWRNPIDVASVLDYIHSHRHDPVAHCDLKPSNVLLDNDLTAHVSDFGLARIIDQESFVNQVSSTGVRGTIGYTAPEYGMGGKPAREGDLYSFGILLLEMFTRKRPTDELFVEDFTLRSYTESALADHVLDIADISILSGEVHKKNRSTIAECLKMVFNRSIIVLTISDMARTLASSSVSPRPWKPPRPGRGCFFNSPFITTAVAISTKPKQNRVRVPTLC
ncbi:hypothetical protein F2Q68_00002180 [Brassica cretica]|uniref:Protein kinase domain-containing protein n=1 Tax=Brassica cretica TaxID=69181 RepID=A0A8S9JN65_BRACR|nr:hypothetical protein F2Q68_00002180 [Brassica cretica]